MDQYSGMSHVAQSDLNLRYFEARWTILVEDQRHLGVMAQRMGVVDLQGRLDGWLVSTGIHTNAGIMGLPAGYCTLGKWSVFIPYSCQWFRCYG